MVKKRKVGNLLALAVLATVYTRPMHRYEMASVMRARGKDQDMDIKWGSLYTVVQNMERHGLLEAIGTNREGARPERTIYAITEAGKRELVDWTRELISAPRREHPSFAAGLSVLATLSPQEAIALFQERLGHLDESIRAQRAALAEVADDGVPRLFLVENEYGVAMLEAEAAWVRSLLDELTSGTFPGLAGWQAWHETGAMPEEMAEIAERGTTPD
ncbi:PadR family transcriptional regulator [Actinoallomurus spadix]|uniref:PadR family transcriptional regulator n=1 Tax=Actinoallomurus spadix TaxID=79912 RepID=A0ABP3G5W7_9ACTN|nr:PadR family transcriptional regulator [Actinoallomurus spadix]MCO5989313.1 PadR family transcriptional regulator [Actinoallomurus spadix]